jgi:DNA polymerase-3 subunit beta
MKFQILQDSFAKGLGIVSRYTANKGQLPILANILIEAHKDGVYLSATNLEIGIRLDIGGKTEDEGQITVPAKNLTEYVASWPNGTVEVELKDEKITVKSQKSQATFATTDAREFPNIPRAEEQESRGVEVESEVFKEISQRVAFAASVDDSRPVLTGVRFIVQGSEFTAVATDGFRLSQRLLRTTNDELPAIILPARTVVELAKLSEGESVRMSVFPQNNQVIFDLGKIQLTSRILEGNFPDVAKIIPREFKTQVTVDREEILKAVKSAGIFARENNNIIKLSIINNQCSIRATGGQIGENEATVEAEIEGDELQISFNYKYLLDFLNSISAERVVMKFNESVSPAVFMVEKDETLIHLIMPVRV